MARPGQEDAGCHAAPAACLTWSPQSARLSAGTFKHPSPPSRRRHYVSSTLTAPALPPADFLGRQVGPRSSMDTALLCSR